MASFAGMLTATSPAAPGTGLGTSNVIISKLDEYESLLIVPSLIGATGGTLDVFIQHSYDEGNNWVDYIHFAQLAAGAAASKQFVSVSKFGGQVVTFPTVGYNLTPTLAAATAVGGPFGSQMRLIFIAGAGTSAGAAISVSIYAQRSLTFR